MQISFDLVQASDPDVYAALQGEEQRQRDGIELIPSENYAFPEVYATNGSVFANKYSEGYPGRRYYGGQQFTDRIELLAVERAKALFRAEHANVQPLSGSPMNQAVYMACLEPGDTILAMDLSHGGHLTHGAPVSCMGKIFKFVRYRTLPPRGEIDYDAVRETAKKVMPKIVLCGHSSYPREFDYAQFRSIADDVGALTMADVSHIGGLIAGGALANPLDAGFDIVTTTTHKSLRGPRGGLVLATKEYADSVDRGCPMVLGGPLAHVMAAKAVAFAEARQPGFAVYAQAVVDNAVALADGLRRRGVRLVTDGTDNHLALLDVTGFGLTGRQAESALLDAGIVTNRNAVPADPNGAWYTSGVRIGTPTLTTRGFGAAEFDRVAELIADVLGGTTPTTTSSGEPSRAKYTLADGLADRTGAAAAELLAGHPLYPGLDLG
jgi:glycine hydroxymethyltransferase